MIDELPLTEGDTKGDLYEYLLSKLTTAGINGQFRTPRHIIRPHGRAARAASPTDVIGDPACGTGGFLVRPMRVPARDATPRPRACSKRLIRDGERAMTYTGDLLEAVPRAHPEASMFHGFDFDATMLRIAAMNLMLHGVDDPDIHYQDTLSNSFPEKFPKQATDGFDVVLANPPFKGSLDRGRPPDAHAAGEDQEDRAAVRRADPAHAEDGRPQRDDRAGRRAVRLVQRRTRRCASCWSTRTSSRP